VAQLLNTLLHKDMSTKFKLPEASWQLRNAPTAPEG
jgi:hypothetical protein